ncbi:MAG: DinB family protein [Vicinamibacterales bacterium]
MSYRSLLIVVVAAMTTVNVAAQGQTATASPTYEQVIARTWKGLHDKLLVMAKDTQFPDDKLGWKPHPDSRSVIEELRHVTIGLEMTSARLRGETFDFAAREKADATKPKTRASVVSEMEAAIAMSYPLVEKSPQPLLIGWIDHQAEHYGKLVSNYRSVGIVPPISRKAGSQ